MIVLINEHQGFIYIYICVCVCVCINIRFYVKTLFSIADHGFLDFFLLLNYSKSCVKHFILQGNARRLLDKHLMRIATKIFKIRTCLDTLVFNIFAIGDLLSICHQS